MAKKKASKKTTEPIAMNPISAVAPKAGAATKPKSKAAAPKAATPTSNGNHISTEDIALRAYYLAEQRRAAGLPGDEASDWLEAERQLRKQK